MDFDQQSYSGRKNFYLPQFFKENVALVEFCNRHLHPKTAYQYQREEQTLLLQRAELAASRLNLLLAAMQQDAIAPDENVHVLREGLAAHFQVERFRECGTMGALVNESLRTVRERIERHIPPTAAEMMLSAGQE